MKSGNFFHDSLADFEEICQRADPDLRFHRGLLDINVRKKPFRQFLIFWAHLKFMLATWREPDKKRLIFVREFSSVPMWVLGFFFRSTLPRLLLFNHHNLQWALHRKANRTALRGLQKRGAKLLFFEFVPGEALLAVGMTEKNCYAIRHPVKTLRKREVKADHRLGILGYWVSDEERIQWIVKAVSLLPGKILIGAPNPGRARADLAEHSTLITFTDTTDPVKYHEAMQRCEQIVLLYSRKSYEYRASGVLSDAVANQVSVLIPDYPVLRTQMEWPRRVGEILPGDPESDPLFFSPDKRAEVDLENFAEHARDRSVEALSRELAGILEQIKSC